MKKLILFSISLLIYATTLAQQSQVRGRVTDIETGEEAIFATVILTPVDQPENILGGSHTDLDGYYSIVVPNPGKYQLVCKNLGYDTKTVEFTVKRGEVVILNIRIEEQKIIIGPPILIQEYPLDIDQYRAINLDFHQEEK